MTFDSRKPCPCGQGNTYGQCCENRGDDASGNVIQRGTVRVMLPGTRTEVLSSMVNGDTRHRIIWNKAWSAPQEQTFHQFLDALVGQTLGHDSFENQKSLAREEQNAIVRWRSALVSLLDRPTDTSDGGRIRTGPVEAYLSLGYDLFWLQLVYRLPDRLVQRLINFEEFQGARYEILIAAVFARAGFEIDWLDDVIIAGKRCEFVAVHKRTRTRVSVEAKSHRRGGALHQPGTVEAKTHLKGDIFGLYEKALLQGPTDGTPFLIFIDANVPASFPANALGYSSIPVDTFPWMTEIRDGLVKKWNTLGGSTVETGVFITNFAFYYGNDRDASPIGMCGYFPSPRPIVAFTDSGTIEDLSYCLRFYAQIPRQF